MSVNPALFGVNSAAVGGGAGGSIGNGSRDGMKHTFYVPLNMPTMRVIYDYYTRGDALIDRANQIRSDQAFGQGYCLEYAGSSEIMPDDAYNYTTDIRALLETACQWRDMFGFVAFVRPKNSARAELERIALDGDVANGSTITPAEIGDLHIQRCTEELHEHAGIVIGPGVKKTKKRINGRIGNESPANTLGAESRRINIMPPRRADDPDMQVRAAAKQLNSLRVVERSRYDGDALSASNKDFEFVRKDFKLKIEAVETAAKQQMTLMDLLITIGEVKIIDIDAGEFFLEIDDFLKTKRVVWVPRHRAKSGVISRQAGDGNPTQLSFVDADPNVFVHVWQGRMPTREGVIQTQFYELMRKQQMIRQAEDNLMDADYSASHPVIFVHQPRQQSKVDAMELPEDDFYGVDLLAQDPSSMFKTSRMPGSEAATYKRDKREGLLLEIATEAANNSLLRKRAEEVSAGIARNTRATRDGLSVADVRASMLEKSGIVHLPGGLQLGGTVTPTTFASVSELYAMYTMELSLQLGVPLSYLRGDQAGSKTSSSGGGDSNSAVTDGSKRVGSGGNTSVAESLMRTTIMRYREDSSAFFDFMYDTLFRESDTKSLQNQLTELNKAKSEENDARAALIARIKRNTELIEQVAELDDTLATHLSKAARLCAQEVELHRVLAMRYRLRLKFLKTPYVDNDVVSDLYASGAISHLEMVNIKRQNVGLTKITEREAARMFDDSMGMTQRRAVAATPHPKTSVTEVVESESKGAAESKQSGGAKSAPGGGGGSSTAGQESNNTKTREVKTVTTETDDGAGGGKDKEEPPAKKKKKDDDK